ncbi:ABC transporter ATP-binding protein [Athalassotoga saccharophila]|uniref:ABC transporter ATP-binding protein n=1 Tax=Athalassotoga saccharophila TaxID=1441386 RepID=UPI00137AFA1C|nr:ABC transporter ATP-binding protein [Athalassotoga saccharophila]BBJ27342.1 ABC transporter, ATP-binding protein [Athalassotoga saccharophila]
MEKADYSQYAVVMKGITKRFPGVLANDHVDLFVKKGEIHAIVGENGAGKTTLMSQLYGLIRPDEGKIYINGFEKQIRNPNDAIEAKIGMVHQHFMLVDRLSVVENIVLGKEPVRGPFFDLNRSRKEIRELSKKFGLLVDPDAIIEDLPVGMQQRVEIIKVLYRGAEILILDEPTAVLTPQETNELFEILKNLQKQGRTIILITHKLNEVMAITESVTVMRLGKVTGVVRTSQTNPNQLANMMVGREVLLTVEKDKAHPGEEILQVKNLVVKENRGIEAVRGLSLSVRKGEIVGIAGVAGNGQTELTEAITGLRKVESGKIIFKGEDITNYSPKKRREMGMGHIPEDRLKHGLIKLFPVYYNFILGEHDDSKFSDGVFLKIEEIKKFSEELVKRFDVRPPKIDLLGMNLSGGNQQKVIVAREIAFNPVLMIVSQPTRGLDVGAIEFIHKTLISMRDKGIGILLVSMELEEIFSLSDRILTIYEGQIMGETTPDKTTPEEVGLMMAGHKLEDIRQEA